MNTIKLKDILSISGKGGLFKFVAQARNGIVVESIEDQKRHIAPSTARVSSLEDIAIFTNEEELPLSDVFFPIVAFVIVTSPALNMPPPRFPEL